MSTDAPGATSGDTGAAGASGGTDPARADTVRSGRRLKALAILAVLGLSALTFLAWSQSWGTLTIVAGTTSAATLDVPGSVAAPALSALALAGIALAGALAIAGPIIRIVLGALEVLLGASVLASAVGAVTDPVAAGASVVTTSTGVAGTQSVRDLVTVSTTTPWAAVTVALGALMIVAGVFVIVTVRRWPQASRKYQAVAFEGADGQRSADPADFFDDEPVDSTETRADAPSAPPTSTRPPATTARDAAVDDWDNLTHGTDPTR
ncbi:Trp biosynthesis-associated membrane protein [Herbiconiux sp. CPCC 205763]|uniref:Trp biosynthesis-associated membrane protein n=1 Tax=Herbiconiux aconitum TaxID=2970913 RepID=A0ABT2GTH6_9MICO|nr:Trp biosynthesis-associated membrane protein [Herbiconiux aconitum]MCS5719483.1 Trp biosynthesis-associated membrane protein [Herbiconiux aconitum]